MVVNKFNYMYKQIGIIQEEQQKSTAEKCCNK